MNPSRGAVPSLMTKSLQRSPASGAELSSKPNPGVGVEKGAVAIIAKESAFDDGNRTSNRRFEKDCLDVFACFCILINLIVVALEIDLGATSPALYFWLRLIVFVFFIMEVLVRIGLFAGIRKYCAHWMNIVDALLLICAFYGMTLGGGLFWNLTVLRVGRWLRILAFAKDTRSLKDLWLVLHGITVAARALAYFFACLVIAAYTMGSLAMAFVHPAALALAASTNGTSLQFVDMGEDRFVEPLPMRTGRCFAANFRDRLTCLDVDAYFGSSFRSAFTMFQLLTLDQWATSVVRPFLQLSPVGGAVLIVFVVVVGIGGLALSVGVLVWSTLELAKGHMDHRSKMEEIQMGEIVKDIAVYFEHALEVEGKEDIELRELRESHDVGFVKEYFKKLRLPNNFGTDMVGLFAYVDRHNQRTITIDQLSKGLVNLKTPATRFDHAKLAANLQGGERFCGRLENRCDGIVDGIGEIVVRLAEAFAELTEHADSELITTWVPEVDLRRAGRMVLNQRATKNRYTECGDAEESTLAH